MPSRIPLSLPDVGAEEKNAVMEVMSGTWFAHGPKNHEFEENFARYIGVRHALTMNSCTSALQLAVQGLGIDGEVIIPSFTWVATANAVICAGAHPVFADIDPQTFCMDPESAASLIGPRTQALMPVHYAGLSADMNQYRQLADRFGLALIEDSAEAIGSLYHGQKTGSFGHGCFSFFPTKNMTVGEGGMLTTNDDDLARRARALLGHGVDQTTYQREKQINPWFRSASTIGYNFRLSNILAAIGVEQLKKLDDMNQRRRTIAAHYRQRLAEVDGVTIQAEPAECTHVYQMFVIRIADDRNRDEVVRELNRRGIGASVHFSPSVHQMTPYEKTTALQILLPVTEAVADSCITLPMYPTLSIDDADRVCDELTSVLSQQPATALGR
ncbi:MAG: DegT/DnrJ/EryC1/StrS family aminotransferase [Planctomycetaceae bacterium]|nr:DegT/DnrJ/EryC1/StrS family aminotransferase [Planctomycetaceae bacterium]MCA9065782.1 DegT/DnrJ/EryC1/StrS family aminotransferase [Planctomycetaceae bacterium]